MNRSVWLLCLILAATPAWAAKKITVAQLGQMLHAMRAEKKSDAEVATQLKQVELTEELTRAAMNGMVGDVPGPLATEQIYVLEGKSAALAPPATDLPADPAPDAAAQAAMVAKAMDYAGKTYAQLPRLTATRTTARFQDSVEAVATTSGMSYSAQEMNGSGLEVTPNRFVRYINSSQAQVESVGGVELPPAAKDTTVWGANGMVVLRGQGPVLTTVLNEARAAGKIDFLRWETVNGRKAAVFHYAVDRKRTHYAVEYCCFPDVSQIGTARFGSAGQSTVAPQLGVAGGGNVQTSTDWRPWKATVPYHGEFFVDPGTGVVVRLILEAEFKDSDVVHQEMQRIDYAPVALDGKPMVVPVRSIVSAEMAQNGESFAGGGYKTRHMLLTSEYKEYRPAQ